MPSKDLKNPRGFLYSVGSANIRYSNRHDIALIYSSTMASVAGVFTKNRIKAAPVVIDMKKVRRGRGQVIFVNSGNANACTGEQGYRDAEKICAQLSSLLKLPERDIYIASTGVIGQRLPVQRIIKALEPLAAGLGTSTAKDVAMAIMTTDSFPKLYSTTFKINKKEATVLGICKGAGMISPSMATMLCFLLTDLAVDPYTLKTALKEVVEETFNLTTVDGDMSTNDTVILMANAQADNTPFTPDSRHYRTFKKALYETADTLARMIAMDGEGATHLVIVNVKGARSKKEATDVARTVANSILVKTAIYGADANWGRIMAAIGRSSVKVVENAITIKINDIVVFRRGRPTGMDREAGLSIADNETVSIDINLNQGNASARIYTCDLTEKYIQLNAEYRT